MSRTTILIVEDEAIVAHNLACKLMQLGHDPAGIAAEGEAAVEMALRLEPQLVLMDINLQGPMDGVEAAGMIQAQCDIPVIYLTAHSDPATLARAKLTGPFGYILKPFEMRDLAAQIELALFKHAAERQQRDQREWLRVTLTSIGDAVIATDAESRITFMNPVAESLTGWPLAEATRRPLKEIFHIVNEYTRAVVDDPVEKVLRLGTIVGLANHTVLIRRDGEQVPIDDSGAPICDRRGRILGAVLVFRDISESKKVERTISQSEARYRILVEHVPASVAMFDREMRCLIASRRWLSDNRLEDRDPIGLSYYDLFPQIPQSWKTVHRRALAGEVMQIRCDWIERADGSVQWLRWEAGPWRDQAGDIGGIVIFSADITDLKSCV
ncbi:PAS domain-containing protein [Desulfosarcina sp.]|uniref:PAS domain-containing protein n=1 Tax=Desulfosarcina sp. TaxID=2027861 RepID=UPI003970E1BF